jgi:DNA-binding ferritin-like protein (Dps family)
MSNLMTRILGDKKERRAIEARASVTEGKGVLDLTGEDLVAFCDELLRGTASYGDRWRVALNRDVARKLAE